MTRPIDTTNPSAGALQRRDNATVAPLSPSLAVGGNPARAPSPGHAVGLRNLDQSSALVWRETVTPPKDIPQRDKDLATLIQATVSPTEKASGFTPVVLDADQEAALGLGALGLKADKNGFITSDRTGFRARIFQDQAGHFILSYSGSDRSSASDWNNNLRQAIGTGSNQYNQAMGLALNVKATFGDNFTGTTGASLGGGLAAAGAAASGVKATTFNAAGLNPITVKKFFEARGEEDLFDSRWHTLNQNAVNYHVLGDALTHLQTDLDPNNVLADAAGKQVTIAAIDDEGVAHNQYDAQDLGWRMRNRANLHLTPSILRGMGITEQA